jgi:hypothetical protein
MSEHLYKAKGDNGTLFIYEDKIEIKREGFRHLINSGGNGNKEINIEDITGIEVAEGYIQFSEEGFKTDDASLFSAPQDANTVYLDKSQSEKAKEVINEIRSDSDDESESSDDAHEQLRKEFAKGNITEEEYRNRLEVLKDTE